MVYITYLVWPHQRICNVSKFQLSRLLTWWSDPYWLVDRHRSWYQQRQYHPLLWLVWVHCSDRSEEDRTLRRHRSSSPVFNFYFLIQFSNSKPHQPELLAGLTWLWLAAALLIDFLVIGPQKPALFFRPALFLWQGWPKPEEKRNQLTCSWNLASIF